MGLDLSDWISQDIYLCGEFEPTTSAIVKSILRPGDLVVDVGANIGYFSLLFAHIVGPDGAVLAYEPVPALSKQLTRNLELNQIKNVTVSNIALSDHRGAATFYVGRVSNTGASSLRPMKDSQSSFDVELAPFDELVDCPTAVSLIKIDVEGAELKVLRGMEKTLRQTQPHLLVEITDLFLREMGDSAEALLTYIYSLGYKMYVILDGKVTLLEKHQSKLPWQWNALCVADNRYGDGFALS